MTRRLLNAFAIAFAIISALSCNRIADSVPEYYIGANFWYGPILGAPEGTPGSNRARLAAELDSLKSIGITNLRVLVGADGPEGSEVKVRPSLHTAPAEYDQKLLEGVEYFLTELQARGMKAVMYLNNAWEWSGGYGSYLEWSGRGTTPDTRVDGYPAYMSFVSAFITDAEAQNLYFDHLRYIVGRFRSSNAIYSWQIANEPRCFSSDPQVQDAFVEFIAKSARVIKETDPKHMVSTGNEGFAGCEKNPQLFERINACPDVDYITIHIWPYNWGWAHAESLAEDVQAAIDSTGKYIDAHLKIAEKLGKNVVIEEFGFPRDGFSFKAGSPVTARDTYYAYVFSRIEESQRNGGRLLGLNFWGWGGLAQQNPENIYWQPGDDYCGDPAQEQQGLNSVYMADSSTVALIRATNVRLHNHVSVEVPVQHGWVFSSTESAKLTARVGGLEANTANITAALVRDLSLMSEVKDTVCVATATAKVHAGVWSEATLDFGRLDPGFYQVNISYTTTDGQCGYAKSFNIGCDPEKIVSDPDPQPDFDQFWEANLAELAAVPMDIRMELIPECSDTCRNVYRVKIKSLGGELMGGIYAEPVAPGKYPAYIEYMGYGADVYNYYGVARPGAIQFLVSVRNQGIFRDEPRNWVGRNLANKENYYYRGAFCDVVRAVDFIASREKTDQSRIFGQGESQGGAFTWIAASLDHRFRAIAPAVPFLSDYQDYSKVVWWPMWEVFEAAEKQGVAKSDLFTMLSYFDVKNFVGRISCPVKMAFGLQDPVCPPHTNFAGYNQVKSEKSFMCVPTCGHAMWEIKEWADTRDSWFGQFQSQD